jgi:hypothetical protein
LKKQQARLPQWKPPRSLTPTPGILTEGVVVAAGFEGTEAITNFIDKKEEQKTDSQG